MQWSDVVNDPSLRDLPYKIELNQWGNIEMSPATTRHAFLQSQIARLLERLLPDGATLTEAPIMTRGGVRVPDAVWASNVFLGRVGLQSLWPEAPEICVEVISPSNSRGEMELKIGYYLAAGAQEVWLVHDDGSLEFHGHPGVLPRSRFGAGPEHAIAIPY